MALFLKRLENFITLSDESRIQCQPETNLCFRILPDYMEVKSAFILSPKPFQPAAKRPPPPLRSLALNNENKYNQRDANQ
jgi:hypothetical protein